MYRLRIPLAILLLGLCLMIVGMLPASTQNTEEPGRGEGRPWRRQRPPATAPAEAPTGGTATPGYVPPKNAKDVMVSVSYDKAEINNVLRFLSMASGIPIVSDSELKGTLTIISMQQIPLSQAFDVVNSALRVRGYAMIGNLDSKAIRVVELKKAVADQTNVRTGNDPAAVVGNDDMVTQIIPLKYISATKLKTDLKPLVSDDQATMLAVDATNSLVITDTAGNIRRILQIINALDVNNTDVIEVDIYTCQFASASAVVEALGKVFNLAKSPIGNNAQPQGRQPNGGQPQPEIKGDDGLISLKGEMRVAADERTNAIIISATREKIGLIMGVVKKLDIDTTSEVKSRIFTLENANAKMVADQLSKLFEQPQGGSDTGRLFFNPFRNSRATNTPDSYAGLKRNIVVADVRTNSVIVTATEQNMRVFETMIKELDTPKTLSEVSRSFPLKYANSKEMAQTLNQLFRGNNRRMSFYDLLSNTNTAGDPISELRNITVVAEDKTNTLLITGPSQSFKMIQDLVEQLDRRGVQVFIEVAIVDVTLDDETKFGIEWQWRSSETGPGGVPEQTATTTFDLAKETLGLKYSVISDNLQALLHALQTRSNVKVYSTPSITTSDNIEARISIGRDEPFVSSETETSGGNTRRSIDFKNVSIALTVTPHVNGASDLIAMDVHQTINEIIGRELELNAPVIANREAKTSVMVNDGQTIVIGGIIKENRERVTRQVPLLSHLPLVGELFKSRRWETEKSELMVFLTPHILRNEASVDAVTNAARAKLTNADSDQVKKIDKNAGRDKDMQK